ncbi:MAG: MFS transporter [Armatimonadetes bacterium CG_4_10_14_3_um_filter_66_18]|nr:NarK/NasA family nitrate transporter [Armatimonadota bacterium]OIO92204.1 MAG: hypothetical protein AUJ96_32670 [Armatimonadetes bacterium CG2_30_66_41]PIU87836.1 MAG: MFS transporter [Armatimonadetes bacterium CG06_land_8_20_14_3_00_66_21]PIX45503.1 MAG: MFS transporter [Armatimonadetes bacterium CG_4_8_14_3_um_filter_66_20]PIY36658.1 MAG: MFS transporter [Armatimonadetes bacterium CG_4_10_14_3_um_filter_66_18]PIZ32457.1 MAG: MFS transporter [Armatimonadetes bacterium CG_4_10_14_0_8_um_fil
MNNRDATKALFFSTLSFTVAFAVWGMIAPMAKTFQTELGLSETQTWTLIAIPVILGSIMRLPMGMLTDRYGGRLVMGALLLFVVPPALLLSFATSYGVMLLGGFLVGMAGTSFSIGIAFSSKWFSPEKQGTALGVYGMGNIGQSVALFCVPLIAAHWGWRAGYRVFALATLAWAIIYLLGARNAPVKTMPRPLGEMLNVLVHQPLAWLLSLFYFVTFGGFVALSIGLPKLLQDLFQLTREDAGMRVAGFVLLATLARPLGGWLSDRIGGAKVLVGVFLGAGTLALGLAFEHIVPFTVGALGVAFFIGTGNGAVFKLVPQYFPNDTGTVAGLVGAMGGLGGFFPPLVLGLIKTYTGSYNLGFYLLSSFCQLCLAANYLALLSSDQVAHQEAKAALKREASST